MKELSRDFLYIFEIIYVIPYIITLYHYIEANKVLLNKQYYSSFLITQNSDNLFSFLEYFIRIAKLYICIVLINIKNIYKKHSHCEPSYFNM